MMVHAGIAAVALVIGVVIGLAIGAMAKRRSSGGGDGDDSGSELYVGNLSYEIDDAQLKKIFAAFGKVVSARVIVNRSSGRSKGYGFVEMGSAGEADAAIRGLNGNEVEGRRMSVNLAKSRPRER